MSLSLVIAEKPSVASDIARALGGFTRDGDFWVREDMVIGSAVGHLLEICAPEEFDVKRGRWTFKNLPVLPPFFDLKPIKKSQEKLNGLVKKLRSRAVTDVINACDAGREGELIFRYIMQSCGSKKPVRRLWLQSMTKAAIQEGFQHLRTDEEMKPLEAAARCRSEADWLVGINGTRAMTAFNSKEGGFFLTTVGRVQTPTLAIVVKREQEIESFVPKSYWEVSASFITKAGEYEGIWINPNFQKQKGESDLKPERIWSLDEAQQIASACQNGVGSVEETSKRSRQLSPLLFDLTSLQREANSRFGFSAKTTLSIAQALYEKHKVLTYPRTDARALPEDYLPTVRETLEALKGLEEYALFADTVLTSSWIRPDKRIFDNKKISDHFAIIPTGQLPKTLNEVEQKIFDLVVRRFLAVFYPAAEYDVTVRMTTVANHQFKTEGKVLVEPGWLAVTGKNSKTQREVLTPVQDNEQVRTKDVTVSALQTKPPARYTEATLLSAMETAGKKLEDDELRGAMADKGLGTPATRASIIEGLLDQKYMRREERELRPMAKAFQLITLLKGLKIDELSEPRLTAEWEQKLRMIEDGRVQSDEFMRDIRTLTENVVEMAKQYEGNSVPLENPLHVNAPCPQCGGEVVENYRRFACTTSGCEFSIAKHPSGRMLEPAEVEELISTGHVGPLSGFISKRGFPFEAELVLKKDENDLWKMQFDFGEEEKVEISDDEIASAPVVGECPCCGGKVVEMTTAYQCEHNLRGEKKCTFRLGKTILSRDIAFEEAQELLANKRTPLLSGFISKKNKRAFKAFLVVKPNGSIAFEFQVKKDEETKEIEATSKPEDVSPKATKKTAVKKVAF